MTPIYQNKSPRSSLSNWLGILGWLIILGYVILQLFTKFDTTSQKPVSTSPDFLPAIAHIIDVKIALRSWAIEYQDDAVHQLIVDCILEDKNDEQILNALLGTVSPLNPKGIQFINGNEIAVRSFWARMPIGCLAREVISVTPPAVNNE